MRIPHTILPHLRLTVIIAFGVLAAVIFGVLWTSSGGRLPLVSQSGYEIVVPVTDADNLVDLGDVMVAGIKVGKVREIRVEGAATLAHVELDDQVAPLHEGAQVEVRNKTLIEETYLQVKDGTGAEIPSGTTLPYPAARSVQVDEVLAGLDPQTRDALGSVIRNSATGVQGRRADVGSTVGGLGEVGREGSTTLTALADQSEDLRSLMVGTSDLMTALDTRQGRIADMVRDSDTVFGAVNQSTEQVKAVVHKLPPVLRTAQDASGDLQRLSGSLAPVASDLKVAAPPLSAALQELPSTSADLRGLLPSLDTTLDRAPATLDRMPRLAGDLRALVPPAKVALSDVNPTLAFVAPYGKDVAGFFTNFAQVLRVPGDDNGGALRTHFILNEQSANSPVRTAVGPLDKSNAVPPPGSASTPSPGGPTGWERVEREEVPG